MSEPPPKPPANPPAPPGGPTPPADNLAADLARIVQDSSARSRAWWRRPWLLALLVMLPALLSIVVWLVPPRERTQYLTEEVTRGDLIVKVAASGTLQPVNQVDIGSEVSGTVDVVLVDDNDRVTKGQLLARLDVSRLGDQVMKSEAAVLAAQAQLASARATLAETRALNGRLRELHQTSAGEQPKATELDAARANFERAVSAEQNAVAAVAQQQAALNADRTTLAKASIRSPIKGVVLSRKVDPGQTVAATLQAPILFVVAEDLTQMELQVDVDEADVGTVQAGQDATFAVDAYIGERFSGKVTRVSLGSRVKDGVVSYTTVLTVGNRDLRLRPGMTASARITITERNSALLVPAAALRFTPEARTAVKQRSGGLLSALMPAGPQSGQTTVATATGSAASTAQRQVWILKDGRPVAVKVTVGVSDGTRTEVTAGDLQPGDRVIVGSTTLS